MKHKKSILVFAAMILLAQMVMGAIAVIPASNDLTDIVCPIIKSIEIALWYFAGTLVMLMFIYGGIKYIFAADDAGARKQGKQTCIHALIGGILIRIAYSMVNVLQMDFCPATP